VQAALWQVLLCRSLDKQLNSARVLGCRGSGALTAAEERTCAHEHGRRPMRSCFNLLLGSAAFVFSLSRPLYAQETKEYNLTVDGVKLLQRIASKDQLIRDLPKGVAAFAALNQLFSKVPGPTKLVVKWNEGLIEGWKTANKHLATIGKSATCLDLTVYIDGDPADAQFFKDLSKIRGCDDL
jgi:hypothetical protein